MRYAVKVTCFWGNQYYKKGDTVEFDESVNPPVHFELLDSPKKKVAESPKKDEPKATTRAKAKAKAKANG